MRVSGAEAVRPSSQLIGIDVWSWKIIGQLASLKVNANLTPKVRARACARVLRSIWFGSVRFDLVRFGSVQFVPFRSILFRLVPFCSVRFGSVRFDPFRLLARSFACIFILSSVARSLARSLVRPSVRPSVRFVRSVQFCFVLFRLFHVVLYISPVVLLVSLSVYAIM